MSPRVLQKGADEKGNSSSPFCARSCTTPSLDASIAHASACPLRRCRRKWQFIVTFLCPQLYDPVPRCLYRPYHSISSKKVPTKMTFNRHLLVVSAESTFRRKSALHSFRRSRVSPAIPHSFRRGMGRSSSLQALGSHFRRKSIQHSFRRSRIFPSCPHSFRRSE